VVVVEANEALALTELMHLSRLYWCPIK